MDRRTFVACVTAGSFGAAGCVTLDEGGGPTPEPTPGTDATTESATPSPTSATTGTTTGGTPTTVASDEGSTEWVGDDGTFELGPEIPEGEWRFWWAELARPRRLAYEFVVRSGSRVEVFVVDEAEYEEYETGNSFRPLAHDAGHDGAASVDLPGAQRFYLVADNAAGGGVNPDFDGDPTHVGITGRFS